MKVPGILPVIEVGDAGGRAMVTDVGLSRAITPSIEEMSTGTA